MRITPQFGDPKLTARPLLPWCGASDKWAGRCLVCGDTCSTRPQFTISLRAFASLRQPSAIAVSAMALAIGNTLFGPLCAFSTLNSARASGLVVASRMTNSSGT